MMTQRYAHLRDETLKRGAIVMGKIVAAAAEKGAREGSNEGWICRRVFCRRVFLHPEQVVQQ